MPDAADTFAQLTLEEFTSRLASAEPVPGGGSASAVAASIAASLLAMVAALSTGREKYAAYAPTNERAALHGERARRRFLDLADEDAAAYRRYGDATRMPQETEAARAERDEARRLAARTASEVPLVVVRECVALAVEIEAMAGRSNLNAQSDLNVAALLAEAAARGAAANVLVNVPFLGDEGLAGLLTLEVSGHLDDISRLVMRTREEVAAGQLRDVEP
jgi:formiminotetrahydrofolate cyclodeaminase